MNSQDIADKAQIAFASYYNFTTSGAPDVLILQDSGKGMATSEAGAFSSAYAVALPTYHDPASDLDVTVFKDAGGNLTLGIRGTLPGHDLLITDAYIASDGAAYDQIVALYNWWQRVSTPKGVLVAQYQLVSFSSSSQAISIGNKWLQPAPWVMSTGELSSALAADHDHKVDVTGHSLGGHLAMAFGTLFPGATNQIAAFNAPGFLTGTANQNFFSALGGTVPSDLLMTNGKLALNVIADEASIGTAPWSAIAGKFSRPGMDLNIAIENQWRSDEPNPIPLTSGVNHSMAMLADSLAVYNALALLDPNLTTATYKTLLNQSVAGTAASYESLIDALQASLLIRP